MRRPARFAEVDLVRALRAAKKADVRVKVEFPPDGRMIVIPLEDAEAEKKPPVMVDEASWTLVK